MTWPSAIDTNTDTNSRSFEGGGGDRLRQVKVPDSCVRRLLSDMQQLIPIRAGPGSDIGPMQIHRGCAAIGMGQVHHGDGVVPEVEIHKPLHSEALPTPFYVVQHCLPAKSIQTSQRHHHIINKLLMQSKLHASCILLSGKHVTQSHGGKLFEQ